MFLNRRMSSLSTGKLCFSMFFQTKTLIFSIWVVVKMLVPEIDVKSELPRCRLMP